MKRQPKFYRRNEEEVMERLGLKPTKGSGAGWIEKADGQNESIICELKSTDSQSYRISYLDLQKLHHHGNISNKVPVFAVQFLQSDEVFLIVKPEDLQDLSKYIETGIVERETNIFGKDSKTSKPKRPRKKAIKSSLESREEFRKEQENKYKKEMKRVWMKKQE